MADQGEKNYTLFSYAIVVCWATVMLIIQVADLAQSQTGHSELCGLWKHWRTQTEAECQSRFVCCAAPYSSGGHCDAECMVPNTLLHSAQHLCQVWDKLAWKELHLAAAILQWGSEPFHLHIASLICSSGTSTLHWRLWCKFIYEKVVIAFHSYSVSFHQPMAVFRNQTIVKLLLFIKEYSFLTK